MCTSISHHYHKRNEMEARTVVGKIESARFGRRVCPGVSRPPGV